MNEEKKNAPAGAEAMMYGDILTAAEFNRGLGGRTYSPVMMVNVRNRDGKTTCRYPVRAMCPEWKDGHFAGVIYLMVNEEDRITLKAEMERVSTGE